MTDSIFVLRPDDSLLEVRQAPYDLERDLQELLDRYPELIPGAQINPAAPRRWRVLRSEAGVPTEEGGSDWWSLDHLLVDQDGIPTFVEVKRASDTRIRREVVAQMLEYAANGTAYWQVAAIRTWFEGVETSVGRDPQATLEAFVEGGTVTAVDFWSRVEENLRTGRVRLVFVADAIPPTLRRLVEFLNEHLERVEVLAVEIPQYKAQSEAGFKALVPRLVGQTEKARAVKGQAPAVPRREAAWTPEEVLGKIAEQTPEYRNTIQRLIDWAELQPYIGIRGGTGPVYPSILFVANLGRDPDRVVLSLIGGATPWLEIRLRDMGRTPPYDRHDLHRSLMESLTGLDIPRLAGGVELLQKRPNVPLEQLHGARLDTILKLIDRWIEDVRGTVEGLDENVSADQS